MKKVLLGSTALVAASLMIGDAYAAEGVKLSVGGRYLGAAGVVVAEDITGPYTTTTTTAFPTLGPFSAEDSLRNYVFKQDVEVYFKGETELDNGLVVGARVELEGQTSGDQIDAVFAYFSGGWGELRFGDTAEALAQLCYLVPSASGLFGADSPFFNFSNAGALGGGPGGNYTSTNGTCYGVDDKATKIVYFSPNWSGFSFAASFTPDDSEDTRQAQFGAGTRFDNNGGDSNNVSVAANYSQDFNGFGLVLGGGATWSLEKEFKGNLNADERADYDAYAQVKFSGFTIGGAFGARTDLGGNNNDNIVYGAGGTYNWDAWTVGLGWTHGDYELGGTTGVDDEDDYDIFSFTASYALGPGIQLDGVVEYYTYEENYEGLGFGIGTLISF